MSQLHSHYRMIRRIHLAESLRDVTTCLIGLSFLLWGWGTPPVRAAELEVTRLPSLPSPISNNAVTSILRTDGSVSMFSFMGIANPPGAATVTAASYRLDLPGGNWVPIRDAPLLNGRAKIGASAVALHDQVYLIGGYTIGGGGEVTERRLFRYDPNADLYAELAPVPFGVDDTVAGVFADRYLVLTSGWHGPINNNTNRVQVYDTQTDTWQQATPLIAPGTGLFGHAGTIIGNQIVVFDGVRATTSFQISNRVFVGTIDPQGTGDVGQIAWQELPAHPGLPTYRAAASQGPDALGRVLVVGGANNPYNFTGIGYNGVPAVPLNQVLAFDPASSTWTTDSLAGLPLPTMDHRGLVRTSDGWATIGGMIAARMATNEVVQYRFVPEPCGVVLLITILAWGWSDRVRCGVTPHRGATAGFPPRPPHPATR